MKKILLTAAMAIAMSTPAMAACEGGTESNGFCISNINLNWWSASNWCKANGRHLATMYEVCPDWDGLTGTGKCPVIASSISEYAWTATASGSVKAFFVHPKSGYVNNLDRNEWNRALCK